jgi:hypothetical protein
MIHSTLLADGRVVGTWKSRRLKNCLEVQIEPFEPLAPEVSMGIEAEVSDLARFLKIHIVLHIIAPS